MNKTSCKEALLMNYALKMSPMVVMVVPKYSCTVQIDATRLDYNCEQMGYR